MISSERDSILEEEFLLVRHSGEIPEVALHSSLHYLCDDADGPKLLLSEEELRLLQEAALARYQEIILRDLNAANRNLSLFRGIRRAHHNWYRFVRFCEKINHPYQEFRAAAARELRRYLRQELEEYRHGAGSPSINCSETHLQTFALALGLDLAEMPAEWSCLCEKEREAF